VAIKLVAASAAHGDDYLRSLVEVRLARGIAHPNVCRVYDIGEADGWCYISMELVDGETLASLLRRIGRLPAEKALDMARQLCAGLAAAHDCGVLHRDLKPSNILLDGRGASGSWISAWRSRAASGRCEIAGTPAYMAPGSLSAVEPLSERICALGLVRASSTLDGRWFTRLKNAAASATRRLLRTPYQGSTPRLSESFTRVSKKIRPSGPSRRSS
jgi:serine/threonine-protein kinase